MKKGFTAGAFDLCHAGHFLMFQEAREQCDYLIVGLHSDPSIDRPDTKNKPIMSVEERSLLQHSWSQLLDNGITWPCL
jgi:glycerol-3-phosphate cytidylyltransferase